MEKAYLQQSEIRITSDFSETRQARKWSEILKLVSGKNNKKPGILYPVKLFLKNKEEIKTCLDKN